ncbi:chaplin [Streptomyces phaeofaciens]|nr:chaplin [Streptomyces phaeofaciens]
MLAVAAASGAMAAVTMPAFADSTATGTTADSPGVVSGNGIQLPVHLPVNLCGNTVSVVGALNPTVGNACANKGGGTTATGPSSGAAAEGDAVGSPGVVSGNGVKVPVDLPLNASGNSVNVVGVLNPVLGNKSENGPGEEYTPPTPPTKPKPQPPARHTQPAEPQPAEPQPAAPKPAPPAHEPQAPGPQAVSSLAQTGSDAALPALLGSAALMLGGAVLYRRFRPGTER